VAPHAGLAGRDADAFFVGLLSVIDSVLGRPMEDVLNELCVTPEIRAALLTRESLLGQPLKLALAYERGNWDEVLPLIQSMGIADAHLGRLYLEAVAWADAVGNGTTS
jgi:EAL and modified HD-GYP domain-containing signal transduction protein